MVKKEPIACENCNCGNCCGWNCLSVILTAIWCIAAIIACFFAFKSSQAAQNLYDFNVLSAGWEENFNRMNEVYKSKAYVDYATQQADQAESYFSSAWDDTTTSDETDVEEDASNIVAWGDEIKSLAENMVSSSPIRGDKDARFTIVEYTELLCPYCQRHSQEWTINAVIDKFPGEVNSVSRHFIIHGDSALQLAAAMECIAELNPDVYHQTFDKAFAAYPIELAGLVDIATELWTNATSLQSCIDEWRYTQAVEDMMAQASTLFGVNGTPGNVIIDRETGNYRLVSGAYPVDEFVNVINELKNA